MEPKTIFPKDVWEQF